LEFPDAMNLIVGDNAQGKTNLLEAIYFLSTAKSYRTRMDDELIKHGEEWFYLKGGFESQLSSTDSMSFHSWVEISKNLLGPKRIKINGTLQQKSSDLIGQTSVVIFSPESLALVKGGPAERRRFLDIFISHINPAYLRCLQDYQLALKQRNELLKQISKKRSTVDLLYSWDKQLTEIGAQIMARRAEIITKLTHKAKARHKELTESDENLDIAYQRSFKPYDAQSEGLISYYNNALNKAQKIDIIKGTTSIGPHRDDLIISVNNFEARRFGSQGQQRTIALSLKLAEIDLVVSETGELPIILLDDVTSELDSHRAIFLFNLLDRLNAQVFVTTTQSNNAYGFEHSPLPSWEGAGVGRRGWGWLLREPLSRSAYTIFEVKNGIINVSNT